MGGPDSRGIILVYILLTYFFGEWWDVFSREGAGVGDGAGYLLSLGWW